MYLTYGISKEGMRDSWLLRQWHPNPVLLPGKSYGWRSLEGCSPWGCWGSDTTERLHFHFSLSGIGEGNGNPFQCSCLENPRDDGAWWAAVYGVSQSRTWLKWLSSSSREEISNFSKVGWFRKPLSSFCRGRECSEEFSFLFFTIDILMWYVHVTLPWVTQIEFRCSIFMVLIHFSCLVKIWMIFSHTDLWQGWLFLCAGLLRRLLVRLF